MGKGPRRDVELERRWRELVEARERSGLSIQAFCGGRGVSASSFHYWKRELASREGAKPAVGEREGARPVVGDFVAVQVSGGSATSKGAAEGVEIEVAGAVVRVLRGFDEETLTRVVRALRAAGAVGGEGRRC